MSWIFTVKTPFNKVTQINYTPHPWIQEAISPCNAAFIPNPDCPPKYSLEKDKLCTLEQSRPDEFKKGDIIWVSFTALFTAGSINWYPEYHPVE
jgi:hypothetical protein